MDINVQYITIGSIEVTIWRWVSHIRLTKYNNSNKQLDPSKRCKVLQCIRRCDWNSVHWDIDPKWMRCSCKIATQKQMLWTTKFMVILLTSCWQWEIKFLNSQAQYCTLFVYYFYTEGLIITVIHCSWGNLQYSGPQGMVGLPKHLFLCCRLLKYVGFSTVLAIQVGLAAVAEPPATYEETKHLLENILLDKFSEVKKNRTFLE